jgi:peptide/nickel transport system substrate-binding protein
MTNDLISQERLRGVGKISRRGLLHMGCALGSAALLSACGSARLATASSTDPLLQASPAFAGDTGSPPKRGGGLTLGLLYKVQTTNPHPQTPSTVSWRGAVFNQLVGLDAKLQPIPDLAQSWALANDGLGVTFTLRQGVKFHNGKDFTAEEAKWNIDYVKDPRSHAQAGRDLTKVLATVRGKYQLELRYPTPLPQIFSLLLGVPIMEPSSDIDHAIAGTGPFKLDSLSPNKELRMVRNQSYWRQGYPLLDSYSVQSLPDGSTLVKALQSGAVQAIVDPPFSQAPSLASGDTRLVRRPGSGNYDVLMTAANKPFSDKRVRQAVSLSIDRKRFVDTALFGQSDVAYSVWPRSSPVWTSELDIGELNRDSARQLLSDAGYADGFETTLLTSSSVTPELPQLAQLVHEDLAAIGIKVQVRDLEANTWAADIRDGHFDIATHFYGFGDQDPALLFTAAVFNPQQNASQFNSDEYTSMVQNAQQERDPEKRLGLYRALSSYIEDQAFALALANRPELFGLRSNVQGFRIGPFQTPDVEETWLA